VSFLKDYGRYGTAGIELVVWVSLGLYGGRWLDRRLDSHGWPVIAGFFFGVFAGFYSLWKTGRAMQRELEREEKREKDGRP